MRIVVLWNEEIWDGSSSDDHSGVVFENLGHLIQHQPSGDD
jgi:hypothetical protein